MQYKDMKNVVILEHPLIQHKISMLRDKATGTNEFRKLVEEIAVLEGYEALRDLPLEDREVETPIETCMTPMIAGKKLAVVPILRAGLGMVEGLTTLIPSARVGHIGMYRDEETLKPMTYYFKLPVDNGPVIVVDPALATGGSAEAAIQFVKDYGCKNIKEFEIPATVTEIEDKALGYWRDEEAGEMKKIEGLTIVGEKGSEAERYANDNGFAFRTKGGYILGDADGDGVITVMDVTAVQKHIAEINILTGDRFLAADVNRDGVVDISDATQIQKYVADINDEYK